MCAYTHIYIQTFSSFLITVQTVYTHEQVKISDYAIPDQLYCQMNEV